MNDDLNIQQLFDIYRPTLADSERFNQRLERKLALIDEIRQEQAADTSLSAGHTGSICSRYPLRWRTSCLHFSHTC